MSTQPELSLPRPRAGWPAREEVAWLETVLLAADRWLKADELAALSAHGYDDRDIRALASASELVVSGHRGYRHLRQCDLAEVDRGCNRLASQGREMIERSLRLRRTAHRVLA